MSIPIPDGRYSWSREYEKGMRRGSILGNEKVSSDSQVDALSCQSPESAKSIQFGPVDNGPGLHGSSFRSIGEPKKWLDRGESAKSMQFGPVEGEPGLQSALSAREALGNSQKQASELESEVAALKVRS